MTSPERPAPPNLFGLPDAETLYDDPAEVYETDIEPWVGDDRRSWEIVEHASRWATDDVPDPDAIVDWIAETYAEGEMAPDDGNETENRIKASPAVRMAAEMLFGAVCGTITYRWADTEVETHEVTFTGDGEPLYDGKPLYGGAR